LNVTTEFDQPSTTYKINL